MALIKSKHIRGKQGKASRSDTGARLLDSLRDLLIEHDVMNVPLLDVARRAGLNVALIKYYFGNRDGLRFALVVRELRRATEQLENLVTADFPPIEKMRIHISGMINLYFRHPYINRLILDIVQHGPPEHRHEIIEKYIKPMFRAYDLLLEAGISSGEFQVVDPMIFYFNVIGACDQHISAKIILGEIYGITKIDDDMRRRFQHQTINTILSGIVANKGSISPIDKMVPRRSEVLEAHVESLAHSTEKPIIDSDRKAGVS